MRVRTGLGRSADHGLRGGGGGGDDDDGDSDGVGGDDDGDSDGVGGGVDGDGDSGDGDEPIIGRLLQRPFTETLTHPRGRRVRDGAARLQPLQRHHAAAVLRRERL